MNKLIFMIPWFHNSCALFVLHFSPFDGRLGRQGPPDRLSKGVLVAAAEKTKLWGGPTTPRNRTPLPVARTFQISERLAPSKKVLLGDRHRAATLRTPFVDCEDAVMPNDSCICVSFLSIDIEGLYLGGEIEKNL